MQLTALNLNTSFSIGFSGAPVLTGTGTVTVVVEDINDHAPQFTQTKYLAEVAENVPVGTLALRLSAFDMDADDNARIRYCFF